MKQRHALFLLLTVVTLVAALWSFMALNAATHKTLDQRAQAVGSQLKCPVCQSESVADSPSLIAQQMRGVIRQQLQAGKSEQAVIQYFVSRYGEQIAWSPPWQGFTLLAWLVPIVLVLAGGVLLFFTLRAWRAITPATAGNADGEEKALTTSNENEMELERYRALLEEELASDDLLFRKLSTEGR